MSELKRLGDIHPDMERYLQEDCYCPGEIYGPDGFFFMVYTVEDMCAVIDSSDDMTGVVATTSMGEESDAPQAIIFWHDEGDGRIIAAQRVDATENNVGIVRSVVQGEKPDGRKLDEFNPGETRKSLEEVMGFADLVIVD